MTHFSLTDGNALLSDSRPALPAVQITLDAGQRTVLRSVLQIVALTVAGAAPVLAIPVHVLGLVDIHDTARFGVLPLLAVTLLICAFRTVESIWAVRGLVAGLVAVTAYDGFRFPFVAAGIWPDFIPRLGGWVTGHGGTDIVMGYLWRYPGDGGGMGMVFFLACAVVGVTQGTRLARYVVALGVGYGVFVWSGLMATVTLIPRGSTMLFSATGTSIILSLVGHLVYGAGLGLCYRQVINRKAPTRTTLTPAA